MKKECFLYSSFFVSIPLLLSTFIYSCKPAELTSTSFTGDKKAVKLAEEMFAAIGGKGAWCDLKSLYIKAIHTEPQMVIPYQSEIWRGIDRFELIIEQQNDSFHVKGIITDDGGTIRYFDKRDTTRSLTEEQLKDWKFDHEHNVYVLLHHLGCNPELYDVKIEDNGRLSFSQDSIFITSFGLDDLKRPHLFYKPNSDGTVSGSIFTHWNTDEGLVHSAGGHPLDSNFMYRTQLWKPGKKPLNEEFGENIFNIEAKPSSNN